MLKVTNERAETAARTVIGAAIEVHKALGPGYSEDVYERALVVELTLRGVAFSEQFAFGLTYKGSPVGWGRVDLFVEECLVVELKAVEKIAEVFTAQVVSYLRATGSELALIINFNVPTLVSGIKRVVV